MDSCHSCTDGHDGEPQHVGSRNTRGSGLNSRSHVLRQILPAQQFRTVVMLSLPGIWRIKRFQIFTEASSRQPWDLAIIYLMFELGLLSLVVETKGTNYLHLPHVSSMFHCKRHLCIAGTFTLRCSRPDHPRT